MTDPIGDMLTRIRNGYLARLREVGVPYSRLTHELASLLVTQGFIAGVENQSITHELILNLGYKSGVPVLEGVKRISKPGLRRYSGVTSIPKIKGGLGTVILSTPKGLMTGVEAKKQGVGGEVLCYIW